MDFKYLEQEVYDALKETFIADDSDEEYEDCEGRNLCAVPPGILLKILNTLVVPVVTALVSEFLIQKLMTRKDTRSQGILERVRRLNNEAGKEISRRSEKILGENQPPGFITQNISANLVVNVSVHSPEEGEKLAAYLEQYLHQAGDKR